MNVAPVALHSAEAVIQHAREVEAKRRAAFAPSSTQLSINTLCRELEIIKGERDQYRARCLELELSNSALTTILAEKPEEVITKALPATVNIKSIVKVVSSFYKVRPIDIISDRRTADIVEPRHVAIYLARILTRFSLPQIGAQFGGRDHTTCLHAFQKIELRRQQDPRFDLRVKQVMAQFVVA